MADILKGTTTGKASSSSGTEEQIEGQGGHVTRLITHTLLSVNNYSALMQLLKAGRGRLKVRPGEIVQAVIDRGNEIMKETITLLYEAAEESADASESHENYAEVNAQLCQKRFLCLQALAAFFSNGRQILKELDDQESGTIAEELSMMNVGEWMVMEEMANLNAAGARVSM